MQLLRQAGYDIVARNFRCRLGELDIIARHGRQLVIAEVRLRSSAAFGGPAAHVAMMQQEVVVRRKWLTATEFLDMYAAENFIPGPNSTEMTASGRYRQSRGSVS